MYKIKEYDFTMNENGSLEGYASTWIREPDAYGDVVAKGAFTNCLAKLKAEGKKIPLIWAHQMDNLKSYIGWAEAWEDEKGLHFIAEFNDTTEAQQVRQMYKDGVLSKFSFAYNILDEAPVTLADGRKANELRELEIYEISCVLVPANPDASVVDVKSGKRNSKKDEQTIKDAINLLQQLLAEVGDNITSDEASITEDKTGGNVISTEDQELINVKKAKLLELINKIS